MRIVSEKELMELIEEKVFANNIEKIREIVLIFKRENFIQNNYEILVSKLNVDIKSILYSEYFWYHQYKREYTKQHKWTADYEQYEFKLLENIDYFIEIDFDIIEKIQEGKIKENDNIETL
ncbi:MAG: hypothetical protein FWG66_13795 [Spirochaetes bacterium]|nr:hypothetical protein [Spirochaetota bacterium]